MSKRINLYPGVTLKQGAGQPDMTSAGNPWTLPDGLADELENTGRGTYADEQPQPLQLLSRDPSTGKIFDARGVDVTSAVSGAGNSQLKSGYGFQVPTTETSGNTWRDISDSGNHLTALASLYGTGNPHANAGYMTSGGDGADSLGTGLGAGRLIVLPAQKFSFDLATDSFVFSIVVNAAAPLTNRSYVGNIAGVTDGYGFYLSGRTGSNVLVPVFNAAGGNWTAMTGYPASVVGTALDGTDHTVTIAYDAPTRSVFYYLDGEPRGSFPGVISPGTASRSTYALGIGGQYGSQIAASTLAKFKTPIAHVWPGLGLPLNINAIVRSIASYPRDRRWLSDVYPPASLYSAIAWVGQSNAVGSSDWPDTSGSLGAPTRDQVTAAGITSITAAGTGSMHPQIASLGGKRSIWRVTLNTAQGSTSLTQYTVGQLCAWVASGVYSKGAYVVANGNVYKLTNSTNATPTVAQVGAGPVTWPGSGTVVDGEATWTYVRAATAADVPGTVLTAASPLFDPNGAIAVVTNGLAAMPDIFAGRKFVCVEPPGQTDKTVGATQAQYTAAIQSLTNHLLSRGIKVLIGFTNSGITAGLDAWLSGVGKPGRDAALASYAGNPNVFAGADLYTALGVLSVSTSGVGLLADQLHMNRFAMPLAASYWDAALAAAGA